MKKQTAEKARERAVKKFIYYFKGGYQGKKFVEWERDYKWNAHMKFRELLNKKRFRELLDADEYAAIALTAAQIESRTNLLFSFEKMALRDAVKSDAGAKLFANGLYELLYGKNPLKKRFENWIAIVSKLPRKQTRVLTWPLVTVFGFLGDPENFIFLKPKVTKTAAEKFQFDFEYSSKPGWDTYNSLLQFASEVRRESLKYGPRDYIDLQSFIWVLGSEEYPD